MVDKDLLITEKDKEFIEQYTTTNRSYTTHVLTQVKLRKQVYIEVDGFYVYEPGRSYGYLNESELRLLADYLTFLNKDREKEMEDYFKGFYKKGNKVTHSILDMEFEAHG